MNVVGVTHMNVVGVTHINAHSFGSPLEAQNDVNANNPHKEQIIQQSKR